MPGLVRSENRSTGVNLLRHGGRIVAVSRATPPATVAVPLTALSLTAFAPTITPSGGADNSVLRLEFEGTDGSTTFTDLSPSARTVTANGSAQIDTAQYNTGTSSMLCPSPGTSYASVASNSVFTVPDSAASFILTASYRLSASSGTRDFYFVHSQSGNWWIGITDSSGTMSISIFAGSSIAHQVGITAATLAWHDVVVAVTGTNLTIEVNGTQVLNEPALGLPWTFSEGGSMQIGVANATSGSDWWLDDFSYE